MQPKIKFSTISGHEPQEAVDGRLLDPASALEMLIEQADQLGFLGWRQAHPLCLERRLCPLDYLPQERGIESVRRRSLSLASDDVKHIGASG